MCATGDQCLAIGLKQCPYCKTVLKSQCSKAQCKVASGGKPTMIISNAATINSGKKEQVKNSSKQPPQKKYRYSDIYNDSSGQKIPQCQKTSDEESNDEDEVQKAMHLELWKESVVKGKWYGAIYSKSPATTIRKHSLLDEQYDSSVTTRMVI